MPRATAMLLAISAQSTENLQTEEELRDTSSLIMEYSFEIIFQKNHFFSDLQLTSDITRTLYPVKCRLLR